VGTDSELLSVCPANKWTEFAQSGLKFARPPCDSVLFRNTFGTEIAFTIGEKADAVGRQEVIMGSLLWVLVAILIIAWLLGLGGVFHLAASLIWIILVIAIVLVVVAFLTGGYMA
jgi:hypothetical protein